MGDFEQWFEQQDFYPKMRYIHGDALFINEKNQYRVLPVQMIYQTWQQWQTQLAVYKEDMQKDAEQVAHLTKMNQRYKGKLQEQQDQIANLKDVMQSAMNQSDEWSSAYKILSAELAEGDL